MSFWSLTTSESLSTQQFSQQACCKRRHAVLPVKQLLLHTTQAMCMMPFGTVSHLAIMLSPSKELSRSRAISKITTEEMIVTIDSLDIISCCSKLQDCVSH